MSRQVNMLCFSCNQMSGLFHINIDERNIGPFLSLLIDEYTEHVLFKVTYIYLYIISSLHYMNELLCLLHLYS